MTSPQPLSPPIVLTTDFGLSDAYVGVMKGVILGINPSATIIDLTHDISPQDLRHGSFVLGTNHSYFPDGTIHVAVVDPGVGTPRKAMVLQTPTATFVGPDNGLFSELVKPYLPSLPSANILGPAVALPPRLQAWELQNPEYRLHPVSNTFHGRDVFAPAAAHLSLGLSPAAMGPSLPEIIYRPLPEPATQAGAIVGEVIYVDRFGNLVTNISARNFDQANATLASARTDISNRIILRVSRTFHDPDRGGQDQPDGLPLLVLLGSNGYLEIALRDGNASRSLAVGVGETVRVSFASTSD